MLTLLGLLFFAGVALFLLFGVVALVFRIAIRLILLPLLLLKWLIGGIVLIVVGPILALVGVLLLVVFGAIFFVPLLPFLLLAGLVWLLVRSTRPAVARA